MGSAESLSKTVGFREHLPALDGARGIAALMVVFSHAANAGLIPSGLAGGIGKIGVGLFFTLSGFLMAYLYAHRRFSRSELGHYVVQRAGRVLPLYYAVILISWLFAGANSVWLYKIDNSQLLHLALIVRGYDVLWTIPVEVHYYIVFILSWWFISVGRPILGIALPLVIIGGSAIAVLGVDQSYLGYWIEFFVIGTITGLIFPHFGARIKELRGSPALKRLGWVLLALSFVGVPLVRHALHLPNLPPYIDPVKIFVALGLFTGALLVAGPFKLLESPPLRWIGKISYGVYLIHRPVMFTLRKLANGHFPGWSILVATLALTMTIAWCSLTFFESPFRRMLNQLRPSIGRIAMART